jgi:phospho-N-acetylmuramoyl-pentapeptide-transferase
MLYHLIYPLKEYINGLNLFRYITLRTAIAIITSLIIFWIFGKSFIEYIKLKTNQIVRKLTPEAHKKKVGTPSMGGVLIVIAIIVSTLISGNLTNPNVIVCLMATIGFGMLGFADDYIKDFRRDGKGISGWVKFGTQAAMGTLIAVYLYFFSPNDYYYSADMLSTISITQIPIPFFSYVTIDLGIFYIPFAAFVIAGFSNAVNITDGLDGLSIGLVLFVILGFAGITYLSGHKVVAEYLKIPFIPRIGEISVFTGAIAGACLGFLWYNAHPAQIFMGDTGSLSLGSLIGVVALMLKSELLLVIIGGVFVMETLSVIIQVASYKIRGKRVFKMAPIHHHFELSGLHENKIIIRLWTMGAILALIGLASLKIR